ncbi:unnamed protein product [Heligmosomoides polygyrus]|uniref:Secreted protein n=1 Tax=Heligmosomoides polygyrus TaxID=6339 RepID=A0A183FEP5_HELPZ|nr:unnamed protein product [Heligmosomoides polygyrus]
MNAGWLRLKFGVAPQVTLPGTASARTGASAAGVRTLSAVQHTTSSQTTALAARAKIDSSAGRTPSGGLRFALADRREQPRLC